MSYKARTDRNRWLADQVIAALRYHEQVTREDLASVIGVFVGDLHPVMAAMQRHGEIVCALFEGTRPTNLDGKTYQIPYREYRWRLGPQAPPTVDLGWLAEWTPTEGDHA